MTIVGVGVIVGDVEWRNEWGRGRNVHGDDGVMEVAEMTPGVKKGSGLGTAADAGGRQTLREKVNFEDVERHHKGV